MVRLKALPVMCEQFSIHVSRLKAPLVKREGDIRHEYMYDIGVIDRLEFVRRILVNT